jgi:hypothetical protein
MKRKLKIKAVLILAYLRTIKLSVLHPLHDLPVPDFNNKYDETML